MSTDLHTVPLVGTRVVGAMLAPHGAAAFAAAPAVLSVPDQPDKVLQVRRYPSDLHAKGKWIDDCDWRAMLVAEQAIALPSDAHVAAFEFAEAWSLRPNFGWTAGRDVRGMLALMADLRDLGALAWSLLQPGVALLIVDGNLGRAVRSRWVNDAMRQAVVSAEAGQWADARARASLAFSMDVFMSVGLLALLQVCHDALGGAADYVSMARNSRGEEFAADVQAEREKLRQRLGLPAMHEVRV